MARTGSVSGWWAPERDWWACVPERGWWVRARVVSGTPSQPVASGWVRVVGARPQGALPGRWSYRPGLGSAAGSPRGSPRPTASDRSRRPHPWRRSACQLPGAGRTSPPGRVSGGRRRRHLPPAVGQWSATIRGTSGLGAYGVALPAYQFPSPRHADVFRMRHRGMPCVTASGIGPRSPARLRAPRQPPRFAEAFRPISPGLGW